MNRGKYMFFCLVLASIFLGSSRQQVSAGNQDFSESPKENTVANVDFINGDFEYPNILDANQPQVPGSRFTVAEMHAANRKWNYIPMGVDPEFGWYTTPVDSSSTNIWRYYVELHQGHQCEAFDGKQNGELNANIPGRLYQHCNTNPGQKIYYEFYHRGVGGEDTMNFYLCEPGASDGFIRKCSSDETKWHRYYGAVTVPDNQYVTEFAFEDAGSSSSSKADEGNLLDGIRLFSPAFLEIGKTVETKHDGYALTGERITYEITVRNTGEAETSRTIVTDILPDGIRFIGETLTMVYINADGSEEELDVTGRVSFDTVLDTLTIAAGREISGQVLRDEDDNEYLNDYANGTYMIEKDAAVIITFQAEVTGEDISLGSEIKNQVRVTYNDLGFEEYNIDENGVLLDDYNVSNVVSFRVYAPVELTLEKQLDAVSGRQERFYFQIVCYPDGVNAVAQYIYYAEVAVPAGENSAETKLKALLPGDYVVTELDNRWYYVIDSSTDQNQQVFLDGVNTLTKRLTFKNNRQPASWIDENRYITNSMTGL